MYPFNPKTVSTDTLRNALVQDDLDTLDPESLFDIVNDTWEQIEPIVRDRLSKRWADANEVWMEAEDRGFFDAQYVPCD